MKNINLVFVFSLILLSGCNIDEFQGDELSVNNLSPRQNYYRNFQKITPCEASGLTYYIDEACVGSTYMDAIPYAMDKINGVGSSINFTRIYDESEADLVFDCTDLLLCTRGLASTPEPDQPLSSRPWAVFEHTLFPSGGTIGGRVWLGLPENGICSCNHVTDHDYTPLCLFASVVLHEMGHAIGFGHNDLIDDQTRRVVHINGTFEPNPGENNYDPGSVMNSGESHLIANDGELCKRPCDYNQNDIAAIHALYPPIDPNSNLEGPMKVCQGTTTEYCMTNNEGCIEFEANQLGVHFLEFCGRQNKWQYSAIRGAMLQLNHRVI